MIQSNKIRRTNFLSWFIRNWNMAGPLVSTINITNHSKYPVNQNLNPIWRVKLHPLKEKKTEREKVTCLMFGLNWSFLCKIDFYFHNYVKPST